MGESVYAQPWLDFLEKDGGKEMPKFTGPLSQLYEAQGAMFKFISSKYKFPPPDTSIKSEEHTLESGLKVRVYTPPNPANDKPIGIYAHGGGWIFGDLNMEDGICRAVSKMSNTVIVSVDYRLAPKHPYPAAFDDCVEAYKWALKNASSLGAADGEAFTIGGSAGGTLALGTALKIIDEGMRKTLKGVVALCPLTIHPDAVPEDLKYKYTSMDENAEYTLNTARSSRVFYDAYAAPPTDKYTSVLLHDRIKDLPKVYMVGCGTDTVRDDARLFKKLMYRAGVDFKYDEYAGYPHYFWMNLSPYMQQTKQEFFGNLAKGLQFVIS